MISRVIDAPQKTHRKECLILRNYELEAKRISRFRKSKALTLLLAAYRLVRFAGDPDLKKERIYGLIDGYYGADCPEKKKIYRDVKRFAYTECKVLSDYFKYRFYTLSKFERKKYAVESRTSLAYDWGYFNKADYYKYFNDKYLFSETFKKYYGRDIVALDDKETFLAFCEKYGKVFMKPRNSFLSQGVSKEDVSTREKALAVWETHKEKYIAEEIIDVEPSLKEFHPASANALRVVTILTKHGPEVLCAYVRFGNNGHIVEHHEEHGSLGAAIDLDTGIIITPCLDKYNRPYVFHPFSHKKVVGYEFKNWDKMIETVKEMAMVVPEIRMIGWDMIIDKNERWIPIEGNHAPGFDLAQRALHTGLQERIEEIMAEDKA